MQNAEEILAEKGLRRVEDLFEIIPSGSFLVDTLRSDSFFAVYPVTDHAHHNHDLLRLFGTHWAYSIDEDWDIKCRLSGDEDTIYLTLRQRQSPPRRARYCFTQKNLEETKSLWIFQGNTPGWDFYQHVILARYVQDHAQYKQNKVKY